MFLLFAATTLARHSDDSNGRFYPADPYDEQGAEIQLYHTYTRTTDSVFTPAMLSGGAYVDLNIYADPSPTYCAARCVKKAYIKLRLHINGSNDEFDLGKTAFSSEVGVKIDGKDISDQQIVNIPQFTLAIASNADSIAPEQWYIYELSSEHPEACDYSPADFDYIRIDVTGYTPPAGGLADSVRMEVMLVEEFVIDAHKIGAGFDCSAGNAMVQARDVLGTNPLTFRWENTGACANDSFPNYQFQLLRLHNTNPAYRHDSSTIGAHIDWNKALTLETYGPRQEITLTVAEGTGFYVWRVRPLGDYYAGGSANDSNWGCWSAAPAQDTSITIEHSGGSISPGAFSDCLLWYEQFNDSLNWVYGRVFTEGQAGRPGISESISFANGLLFARQTQSTMQSAGSVLAAATLPDFSGRAALSTLAAPVAQNGLAYIARFVMHDSALYTAQHFDMDGNYLDADPLDQGPLSEYYSNRNTADSTLLVPNADSLPFARTLYYAEAGSRIQEQGGPGRTHRLGGGRTLRTGYSKANDRELISIFGDEAPIDSSVTRVITLDQNDVAAVQYIEKEGRVLATCLIDQPGGDSLLSELDERELNELVLGDTLKSNRPYTNRYSLIAESTVHLPDALNDITLTYRITPQSFSALCENYCAQCDYIIALSFTRLEPDSAVYRDTISIPMQACPPAAEYIHDPVELSVPAGQYSLKRVMYTNNPDAAGGTPRAMLDRHTDSLRALYAARAQDSLAAIFGAGFLAQYYDPAAPHDAALYDSLLANYQRYYQALDSSKTLHFDTCCALLMPESPCPTGCDPMTDFEQLLYDTWAGSLGADSVAGILGNYFLDEDGRATYRDTSAQTGLFNALVDSMIAHGYACEKLWRCWEGLVLNYDHLAFEKDFADSTNPAGTGSFLLDEHGNYVRRRGFNLLQTFLDCAGTAYCGYSAAPFGTGGYLSHAWNTYPDPGEECRNRMGYLPGDSLWTCGVGSSDSAALANHRRLRACALKARGDSLYAHYENKGLFSNEFDDCHSDSCIAAKVQEMVDSCLTACEGRRASFKDSLLTQFVQAGNYVQGYPDRQPANPNGTTIDSLTLNCLVDAVVEHCGAACNLTMQVSGDTLYGVGTAPEIEQYGNARYNPWFSIRLPQTDGSCAAGYTRIGSGSAQLYAVLDSLNLHLDNFRDTMAGEIAFWKYDSLWISLAQNFSLLAGACPIPAKPEVMVFRDADSWFDVDRQPDPLDTNKSICRIFYRSPVKEPAEYSYANPHPFVNYLNSYLDAAWGARIPDHYFSPDDSCKTAHLSPGDYYTWYNGSIPNPAHDPIYRLWYNCIDTNTGRPVYCDFAFPCINGFQEHSAQYLLTITSAAGDAFRMAPGDDSLTLSAVIDIRVLPPYGSPFSLTAGMTADSCSNDSLFTLRVYYSHTGADTERYEAASVSKFELTNWINRPFTSRFGSFFQSDSGYLWYRNLLDLNEYPIEHMYFGCAVHDCAPTSTVCEIPCDSLGCGRVCFRWEEAPDVESITRAPKSCAQQAVEYLLPYLEGELYGRCLDTQIDALREDYYTHCAAPGSLADEFTLQYALRLYHYTLYYYDRAGNLIKTVPPKGVDLSDAATRSRADHPDHQYATLYEYNSLGQLVRQHTPDGGATQFWYNALGQLRLSRDAAQAVAGDTYSFSKYDGLGRIIESGQISSAADPQSSADNPAFPAAGAEQITRTVYSAPAAPAVHYGDGSPQRYLQNRVSYSYSDLDGDTATAGDRVSTYYSYDPHGNVEWLVQDIPGLGRSTVRYEYDLISGKVRQVLYQEGRPDRFYQRFSYDDDSRLVLAESSRDGQVWERDARYEYYAHGPLRRAALGTDNIQGRDFVYTIHGWLKAINHPERTAAADPGGDGSGSFAADAFAMTLGYYPGDFARANGGLHSKFNSGSGAANSNLNGTGLYNGNIASWTSNTQPSGQSGYHYEHLTGAVYRYDKLNRLKNADFRVWDTLSARWGNPQDYDAAYSYDANGNIKKLTRREFNKYLFDNFDYFYDENIGPPTNRLTHVKDLVKNSATAGDIEDAMPAGNYDYDDAGRLVADGIEGITEITWTVADKVREVVKDADARITFLYDAAGRRVRKDVYDYIGGVYALEHSTWYVYDGAGNVLSHYKKQYSGADTALRQSEIPLYGSKRLGVVSTGRLRFDTLDTNQRIYTRRVDETQYELKDHLGNVRALVGDVKLPNGANYIADLKGYYNYYPFGMRHPGRFYESGDVYRYLFNGMEQDGELKGDGNSYTTEYRHYDPRLGRWTSLDPLMSRFPWMSPYVAYDNNPIFWRDPLGLAACQDCERIENPQEGQTHRPIIREHPIAGTMWGPTFVYYAGSAEKDYKDAGWLLDSEYYKKLQPLVEHYYDDDFNPADYGFGALDRVYHEEFDQRLKPLLASAYHGQQFVNGKPNWFSNHGHDGSEPLLDLGITLSGGYGVGKGVLKLLRYAGSRVLAMRAAQKTVSTVLTRSADDYINLLKPQGELEVVKTLYRGTTGSEKNSAVIFLTDDATVAATYVKNGGQVMEYRVSEFALKSLELSGELSLKTGIHGASSTISQEFMFRGTELLKALNSIATPLK